MGSWPNRSAGPGHRELVALGWPQDHLAIAGLRDPRVRARGARGEVRDGRIGKASTGVVKLLGAVGGVGSVLEFPAASVEVTR